MRLKLVLSLCSWAALLLLGRAEAQQQLRDRDQVDDDGGPHGGPAAAEQGNKLRLLDLTPHLSPYGAPFPLPAEPFAVYPASPFALTTGPLLPAAKVAYGPLTAHPGAGFSSQLGYSPGGVARAAPHGYVAEGHNYGGYPTKAVDGGLFS